MYNVFYLHIFWYMIFTLTISKFLSFFVYSILNIKERFVLIFNYQLSPQKKKKERKEKIYVWNKRS